MRYGLRIWLLVIVIVFTPIKVIATHILVIESYHKEYPWDIEYKKALADYLGDKYSFSYFQMDTKRILKQEYEHKAELAWRFYLAEEPDLVVLADDNALKYLGPRFKTTDTPVVYLGINNNPRNYAIQGAVYITGVLERPLLKRSILVSKDIIPHANKALVLFDSGNTSYVALQTEFNNQNVINIGGIETDVALIEQYTLWQQKVLSAKKDDFDVIFIGLYQTLRNEQGVHVTADEVLSWTSQNSPVPLLGFWDFSIGAGKAAGGLVLSGEQQGIEAAKIIQEVFLGTPIKTIRPRSAEKGRFIFSSTEVNKYQLVLPESIAQMTTWVK